MDNPIALINGVPSTTGYLGGSVELRCEVLGYAMTSDPPMWSSDDGADLISTSKYMICTTSDGANSLIYSDGSTGQSIVSILTIYLLDPGDRGNYTCTTQRNRTTIQLLISSGTAPPTTGPPSSVSATTSNFSVLEQLL